MWVRLRSSNLKRYRIEQVLRSNGARKDDDFAWARPDSIQYGIVRVCS
jgi:hypothetical protein